MSARSPIMRGMEGPFFLGVGPVSIDQTIAWGVVHYQQFPHARRTVDVPNPILGAHLADVEPAENRARLRQVVDRERELALDRRQAIGQDLEVRSLEDAAAIVVLALIVRRVEVEP